MRTKHTFQLLAALAVPLAVFAQQQPQPTQQPAVVTSPCTSNLPPPPHKQGWLEQKARELACQKNKNLCSLPSSPTDVTGTVPAQKPCNPAPTPAPKPLPAPAQPAAPDYVCPPKAKLIAGHPYCIYPDNTVVDAIPLSPAAQQAKQ